MWPSPVTMYFVDLSSGSPIGPRACSFCVEIPISAPNPNWPPSVKRVDAFTATVVESTNWVNRRAAACDVVMTNCYPFWEGCPREQALAYMQTMVQRTRAAAPGKRVLISETGWPDQGSPFHGSVP